MNRFIFAMLASLTTVSFAELAEAAESTGAEEAARRSVTAPETSLGEARIVELAAREAPVVAASKHDASAAEAQHSAAERARLPDLAVSARYTRLSSIPSRFRTLSVPFPDGTQARFDIPQLLDAYGARATLIVPISDAWLGLSANARAIGNLAQAKRIEVEATRARVAFEARAAFLVYQRASFARRVAESALTTAKSQSDEQQQRVLAGTASPSSSLAFDAARNLATARLRIAEADVSSAEAAVRAFLPESTANVPLATEGEAFVPPRGGIEGSPVLRAAEAAIAASDARVDAETLAMLPRLSLVAGAEVMAPSARAFAVSELVAVPAWDVSIQLDWSLSSVTTGTARQSQAESEREAARARAVAVKRELEAQRAAARAARASAEARVSAGRNAVETAKKLAETRRTELAAGVATALDLTNAESESVRAELEQIDATLELRLAEARLAYTAGYTPPVSS